MVTRKKVTTLGVRAYARHRGVSHVAVIKAIQEGRIQKDADGKIQVDEADRAWSANTTPKKTPAPKEPPAAAPKEPEAADGELSFSHARTQHEKFKYLLRELEYQKLQGTLVDATETRDRWFKTLRVVRDSTLGLPDRLSDALALETDPLKVHELLTHEIRVVLSAVADELIALAESDSSGQPDAA